MDDAMGGGASGLLCEKMTVATDAELSEVAKELDDASRKKMADAILRSTSCSGGAQEARSGVQRLLETVEETAEAATPAQTSITFRVTASLTAEVLCSTTLEGTETVRALKEEVARVANVPTKQQRLMIGKRILRDATLLEDFVFGGAPSGKPVDVSLLKVQASEDPETRTRSFREYTEFSIGRTSNRWEYHQSRAYTETDLHRGMGMGSFRNGNQRLFVTLRLDDHHQGVFNLCSLDFPLKELFDTFAEQLNVPIADLQFSHQGRRLGRDSTPHLCGMEPCDEQESHLVEVSHEDARGRRRRLLGILNSMGEAGQLQSCRAHASTLTLGADGLLRALLFLPLEDLLQTTVVSSFWFHATQRLSLMLQLRHGDVAFTSKPPEEYTAWLTNVFGHSQQLAVAEAQSRRQEAEAWQGLHIAKERVAVQAYTFCKAAGCTDMKTVALSGVSAEFEQQWLSLHSSKVKFMSECKAWCEERNPEGEKKSRNRSWRQPKPEPVAAEDLPAAVAEATQTGKNATTEALTPQLRAVAVELFRRYFSPDMYFIFPLIVGREAAFGLDFATTTTTLFFGPRAIEETGTAAPAGACSWRFRWPAELQEPDDEGDEAIGGLRVAPADPMPFLEVLFIAVWEEERDQVHGGSLIGTLEAQARAAGVKMMYVEIGFEQPKARRFWRKQGFGKVVRKELSDAEKQQVLDAEEQEEVAVPLIPLSDAQLAFFDSQCLRFSDTAQYVKSLQ